VSIYLPITRENFLNGMSNLGSGVCVIACRTDSDESAGLTISSLTSVSLSPPLISWNLAWASRSSETFRAARNYGVSILSNRQADLATSFANSRYSQKERFEHVNLVDNPYGVPLIAGAVTHLVCSNRSQYRVGDHTLLVGEVIACSYSEGTSLIYRSRRYLNSDL